MVVETAIDWNISASTDPISHLLIRSNASRIAAFVGGWIEVSRCLPSDAIGDAAFPAASPAVFRVRYIHVLRPYVYVLDRY